MPSLHAEVGPKRNAIPWRWALHSIIASTWIAVCATTPEFIWRGARIVARHFSWTDLASAIFIGLILAFCVEPAMERVRHRFSRSAQTHPDDSPTQSPVFAAAMGLAFALASVCLHDAITAFLSAGGEDHSVRHAGLVTGIEIASAWTMVPFLISLAWLSFGRRRLRVPLGILAAISPMVAGGLFSWSVPDTITTEVPCLAILLLGYRAMAAGGDTEALVRCAQSLAWFAPAWLVGAMLLNHCLGWAGLAQLHFYTISEAWIDARFYFGWAIGLLLVPFPTASSPQPRVSRQMAE